MHTHDVTTVIHVLLQVLVLSKHHHHGSVKLWATNYMSITFCTEMIIRKVRFLQKILNDKKPKSLDTNTPGFPEDRKIHFPASCTVSGNIICCCLLLHLCVAQYFIELVYSLITLKVSYVTTEKYHWNYSVVIILYSYWFWTSRQFAQADHHYLLLMKLWNDHNSIY